MFMITKVLEEKSYTDQTFNKLFY